MIKLLQEIPRSVFWSAGSSNAFSQEGNTDHCLCNEERMHLFFISVTTKGKICEFHVGCCACILSILIPGKKMLISSPTRKSSIVNIIMLIMATYLLKWFNFKVFIDFWPWFCWELNENLANVNKLAYFMTD